MSGCSPSACSTCSFREIEEQMKKKTEEAKKQAEQTEKA